MKFLQNKKKNSRPRDSMACCIETAELARDTDHVFNKEDAENEYD